MSNPRSIQGAFVLAVCLILAVILGNLVVTDAKSAFLWIGATVVVSACLLMGTRVWLLVPFMTAVELGLRIPGNPSSGLAGQILALGFCGALFLTRRLPYRSAITELEILCGILALFVLQAYLRNPVGISIFGGDTVGGKPYFTFGLTMAVGLLLAGLKVAPKDLKRLLHVTILGGLVNAVVSVVGTFVPSVGFYLGGDFNRSDEVNYENFNREFDPGAANRITFLGTISRNIALWLSCFISPLKACLHPLWVLPLLFSIFAAGFSGYRNAVAAVGLTYLIGLAYRGGFGSILFAGLGGTAAVALLAGINVINPLPPNVQRALTFLPGTWEERYKGDAKASSDWRYEMWVEVLTSDKYIKNKWIGDGLGFSAEALRQSMVITEGVGSSGFDQHRESIMVSGDYHSGPVQTIRIIGYSGLGFLMFAMLRLIVHAHRQILRCRGTEWYPLALIVGIPLIAKPILFAFVFGDFLAGAATLLIGSGMVRMLQNNLPLPAYKKLERVPVSFRRHAGSPPAGAPSLDRPASAGHP